MSGFGAACVGGKSVEWWMKTSAASWSGILGEFSGDNVCRILWGNGGEKFWTLIGDNNGTNCASCEPNGTGISDGNWHHYVLAINQAEASIQFYIDGDPVEANVTFMNMTEGKLNEDFTASIVLGNIPGMTAFDGDLAEIAFYPFALSAGRVAAHFAAAGI